VNYEKNANFQYRFSQNYQNAIFMHIHHSADDTFVPRHSPPIT